MTPILSLSEQMNDEAVNKSWKKLIWKGEKEMMTYVSSMFNCINSRTILVLCIFSTAQMKQQGF